MLRTLEVTIRVARWYVPLVMVVIAVLRVLVFCRLVQRARAVEMAEAATIRLLPFAVKVRCV